MSKKFLETFIGNQFYPHNDSFEVPRNSYFSNKIDLFDYQMDALENLKKLFIYINSTGSYDNYKNQISNEIVDSGIKLNNYNIKRGTTIKDKERFSLLSAFYNTEDNEIKASNFLNRAAFWMATGSGKTYVLLKSIEYLYNLMENNIIPKKDILLLLPKEQIITQFKEHIKDYNLNAEVPIDFIKLNKYSESKRNLTFLSGIDFYYYRSDLLRDQKSESIIDFKDYENDGNWYILMDEAHRGETGTSKLQDYVSIMSRKGFLFNFSATFTDEIDYITTLYNFNLEKFIKRGYGKNIFLSPSLFRFKDLIDEMNIRDKSKQVIKSLLTLALIKKSKNSDYYHNPLMVTLVNTVNTEDSDLLLFFEELEKVATGSIDEKLYLEAKEELFKDIKNGEFVFDTDVNEGVSLKNIVTRKDIINIDNQTLLKTVFNSNTYGKIEIIEGINGKEIALKLATSEKPFALIKIGDADKFKRDKLGSNYLSYKTIKNSDYFSNLNNFESPFNILLGSRSFYEGWDSNRPNVINLINIGGADAKKFVLQALGRGVRIEPVKGSRMRLDSNDINKNELLETLFVFSTDKNGVKTVLNSVESQKTDQLVNLSDSFSKNEPTIDLYLPVYKKIDNLQAKSKFAISKNTLDKLKKYFLEIPPHSFIVRFQSSINVYNYLKSAIKDDSLFMLNSSKEYHDIPNLMKRIIEFVNSKKEVFDGIKVVEDEIKHYEKIYADGLSDSELTEINDIIKKALDLTSEKEKELTEEFSQGHISRKDFIEQLDLTRGNYELFNISNHFYTPVMLSHDDKESHIKNIITEESEVAFIKSLNNNYKLTPNNWMFSYLNENTDEIYIPYFSPEENKYKKFYPDFLFWMERGDYYDLIFVDPKGTRHSDYQFKIDGYRELFTKKNTVKTFDYENKKVRVFLKLVTDNINTVSKEYQPYWISKDDFSFIYSD